MRTTVDIPDALGKQVKIRAAQLGSPLKVFITRALEREVAAGLTAYHPKPKRALPVIKSRAPGSLKITPEEISAVLVREEAAAYAADVRR